MILVVTLFISLKKTPMKLPFAQRLQQMTQPVQIMDIKITEVPKFELLCEEDGSLLMVDPKLKIIRLEWLGTVKKEQMQLNLTITRD